MGFTYTWDFVKCYEREAQMLTIIISCRPRPDGGMAYSALWLTTEEWAEVVKSQAQHGTSPPALQIIMFDIWDLAIDHFVFISIEQSNNRRNRNKSCLTHSIACQTDHPRLLWCQLDRQYFVVQRPRYWQIVKRFAGICIPCFPLHFGVYADKSVTFSR